MSLVSTAAKGGTGGTAVLFAQTLGADAASIDTGASGFSTAYTTLLIELVAQTADAAGGGNANMTVNNDTSASYDLQQLFGINVTPTSSVALGGTSWGLSLHGVGGTGTYPGIASIVIPRYSATTFSKIANVQIARADATAANNLALIASAGYRGTAAITRVTVTGATANLKAGSSLVIYGLT